MYYYSCHDTLPYIMNDDHDNSWTITQLYPMVCYVAIYVVVEPSKKLNMILNLLYR